MSSTNYYDLVWFQVLEHKNEFEILTDIAIKEMDQNDIKIEMLDFVRKGMIHFELWIILELVRDAQSDKGMVRYKLKGAYKFRIRTRIGILFNKMDSDNAIKVKTELIESVLTQMLLYAKIQTNIPEDVFQSPTNSEVLKWAKILPGTISQ